MKKLFDTNTTDEFGATQYVKIPKKAFKEYDITIKELEEIEAKEANNAVDDARMEDMKFENEYPDTLSGLQDAKDAIGDEYR